MRTLRIAVWATLSLAAALMIAWWVAMGIAAGRGKIPAEPRAWAAVVLFAALQLVSLLATAAFARGAEGLRLAIAGLAALLLVVANLLYGFTPVVGSPVAVLVLPFALGGRLVRRPPATR